ncbi:PREDICTED: uncharacterized protein LOC106120348 isoform X2 [Papilio xuthus]|uniref:Uncharacterized protein LOC106120348 isoform X2 n=1 Tax=Papilio xuthus TaxID=66420 RepID=A0AAJ7EBY7_PAPXU|nr:PREDICTED: uncharacterized protein LOC106120348 isoform X2 [Papilio xuthus]
MIYVAETKKGDRKSIYLFSVRSEEELKQLQIFSNGSNEDIVVSGEDAATNSGISTNDSEECTNIQKSKDTNELHDKDMLQSEFINTKDNKTNKQNETDNDVLKDDLESKVTENGENFVIDCDNVNTIHENTKAETWDDYDCFKISQENFFPSKVINLNTQKNIITRFLNFYVGGKVPKEPNTNKFSDYESKNNVAAPPCHNEETPNSEEKNNIGTSNNKTDDNQKTTSSDLNNDVLLSHITDLVDNMSLKWRGSTSFASPCEVVSKQYGPAENSVFISSCNKLLIAWEESKESRSRLILKWFFGIIALTLMRGIVKRKKNILNTFQSKTFLNKITFINSYINYIPPQESCVERCCNEMMVREKHHKVMFAKILFNSIRIDILQREHAITNYYGLYNIFRMCVVDHTSYYDMGILNLLKSIYGYVGPGTQFSIILSDLKAEEINDCMVQVRNFMMKYMKKENCWTYHWARYFDSTQFEYLSCSNSYATAVLLAVFVEKKTHRSDVWRSGWVRTQQVDLDRYKQLGEQLYKQYECLCQIKCVLKLCFMKQ